MKRKRYAIVAIAYLLYLLRYGSGERLFNNKVDMVKGCYTNV